MIERHTVPALGTPIPDVPHAVSVSMPTWADVVGYEEGDPRVLNALACGYPRFVFHPQVRALRAEAERRLAEPGEKALVLPTARVATRCLAHLAANGATGRLAALSDLAVVLMPESAQAIAKQYWQHTGEIVSSRRAEAFLAGRHEADDSAAAKPEIRRHLAALAGTSEAEVTLYPTGMAAIAQALRLMRTLRPGLPTAQCCFPYIDSLKLQERLGSGTHFYPMADDRDLDDLERLLAAGALAGVFCEFPSNPLMRSVDLPRLSQLTRAAGVPLVVDDSIATFYNHDFLPYVDMLVSSLTKNFSGRGSAMGGALVLNPGSPHYAALETALAADYEDLLYGEDAAEIAAGAVDFEARMARMNATTEALVEALAAHPAVDRVYYPSTETPELYAAARRPHGGHGAMFSLLLADAAAASPRFYDRLEVDKGPSFGLRTTLACPYTILAHYTELDWAEQCGVPTHLIRVSVGLEDLADLLARFRAALSD